MRHLSNSKFRLASTYAFVIAGLLLVALLLFGFRIWLKRRHIKAEEEATAQLSEESQ